MALFLFAAILLSAADKLWAAERCCEGLRCYNDNPPFNGLPPPQCPEDMSIIMKVFTRENPTTGENITRDTIPSVFKSQVMTMFVVHGFMEDETAVWMHDIKDAVLKKVDYNVIIVGWKGGSQNPYFPQAASNTRTAGGEIALVANNTINKGLSSKALMHCVGASLGGHVCGHAGQQGQFARISALDPAGPIFDSRDWSIGVNPSCADLVDIIHTDGRTLTWFGLGTMKILGHVDFYPNGGNKQPGCGLSPVLPSLSGEEDFMSTANAVAVTTNLMPTCSHLRSALYFIESISTPCFRSRHRCENQDNLPESCRESRGTLQSMGFNATEYSGRGIFYLKTNSLPPFCRR